ncbi:MAG: PH domain-containing protein [Planctomycetes bacterium]|nr:PH domain-containing protein [Planctomycetota bacterium]
MRPDAPVKETAAPAATPGRGLADGPRAYPLSRSTPEELGNDAPARSRLISPSLLLPAEVVLFELKPSLWYVAFASLPIAAVGAAIVALAFCIQQLESVRYPAVVVGMWVIGLRVAVGLVQWLGRTYVLTDRRALVQTGVFDVKVQAVALEKVANTFVAQAVIQRLLGIGTIFFRTDDADGQSLAWEHVRRPKEVHGHVVAQIDRWKRALDRTGQA